MRFGGMMEEMEKFYRLALFLAGDLSEGLAKKLIKAYGSARAVFESNKSEKCDLNGKTSKFPLTGFNKSTALRLAEKELEFTHDKGIQILFEQDPAYPQRLKHCADPPFLLFFRGNADLNHERIISIVGTRNATNYGRSVCRDLLQELKAYQVLVVSGMAYGIDAYAHQGAVNHQIPTVGVLGHGLDRIYPQSHTRLAQSMLAQGGLLSEFPSQTKPERYHFPRRNRIIAGMCDVVLVVEAPQKGGALITAELANSYNREVAAVPGNMYQEFSKGCNDLIRKNKAFSVSSVDDLTNFMNWMPLTSFSSATAKPKAQTEEEKYIVKLLHQQGVSPVESLMQESGMEPTRLSLLLLELELKDLIIKLPGNRYTLRESGLC